MEVYKVFMKSLIDQEKFPLQYRLERHWISFITGLIKYCIWPQYQKGKTLKKEGKKSEKAFQIHHRRQVVARRHQEREHIWMVYLGLIDFDESFFLHQVVVSQATIFFFRRYLKNEGSDFVCALTYITLSITCCNMYFLACELIFNFRI